MIYKETEIKNPFYITVLNNGVTLFVYDGYGEGSDGCVYHPVIESGADGDFELVGWEIISHKI